MKTTKTYSIIFVLLNSAFCIGIFYNYAIAHLEKKQSSKTTNPINCSNWVDWKKEYPLDVAAVGIPSTKTKSKSIYEKAQSIIDAINSCTRGYAPARMKFIEYGHLINKVLNKNIFLNLDGLIRFDNGYFGYLRPEKDSFEEDGKRVVEFQNYLKNLDIKFGYIVCPSKFSKFKKDLPKGMVDSTNENADSLLNVLYKNKVSVLDLRENMKQVYPDHFSAFFKTDHHWKPETGFWAANQIIKFINSSFAANLNEKLLTKENFNFKAYPKLFLGSQGKKVSLTLAEPEDFTVITPKFETEFEFEIYCRDIIRKGNFEESILDKSKLKKDYYNINTYGTYLGADTPVVRIKSTKEQSKLKVLLLKDSFACVTAPFLSCLFKELILVDVREGQSLIFDGSIKKFIAKEKPDIVLISYNCDHFCPTLACRKQMSTFY